MDREKRPIKKPKKYQDEAFYSPLGEGKKQTIKVKLSRPSLISEKKKDIETPKISKNKVTVKPESPHLEQKEVKPTSSPKIKLPVKQTSPLIEKNEVKITPRPKIKLPLKQATTSPRPEPKEIKPKEVKPKEVKPKEAKPKEAKSTPKPKNKVPVKPSSPRLEQNEVKPNPRPKNKLYITPIADLVPNVVLPFWDARTAAEEHEDDNVKELVHCHCTNTEELGLMVQCETCLTWQHAHCLGIQKPEEAPDGYTCKACSDPRHARESMKWAYDQDWLTKGVMKQFPCDPNAATQQDVKILYQINKLIEALLYINKMIHSLKVKSRLLTKASDDDQDLKLFKIQWQPNYQHRDGSLFIPSINHPSSTPTSTISAIGDSPEPGDIGVDPVTDGILPEIGQLDVSAILDNSYANNNPTPNQEVTPDDCRANLKLHIQQTEEFIGLELRSIEEQFSTLEKEVIEDPFSKDLGTTLSSLKNDLLTMKKYLKLKSGSN